MYYANEQVYMPILDVRYFCVKLKLKNPHHIDVIKNVKFLRK